MGIKTNKDGEHVVMLGLDEDFDLGNFLDAICHVLGDDGSKDETKEPNDYIVAACIFENNLLDCGNHTYNFRLYDNACIGDIVVVDTQYGMQVAKIADLLTPEEADIKPEKDVVCIINTADFDARHKAEKESVVKKDLKDFIMAHGLSKGAMKRLIHECFED